MTGVHSMKSQLLSYGCSRNWKFSKVGKDRTRCFDTLCFSLAIFPGDFFWCTGSHEIGEGNSSWGEKWLCAAILHPWSFSLAVLKEEVSVSGVENNLLHRKKHMEWHQNHRIIFVRGFAGLLVRPYNPPKGYLYPSPVRFWPSWRIS